MRLRANRRRRSWGPYETKSSLRRLCARLESAIILALASVALFGATTTASAQSGGSPAGHDASRATPALDSAAWDAALSDPEQQQDSRDDIPLHWARVGRPRSQFQFDYYRDSGGSQIVTMTSLTDVRVGQATFTLRREKVTAHGTGGAEGSEATVVSGYGKPWKWLLVGGGIGVIRTRDGSSSPAGSLTSSMNVGSMSITLSGARGLLQANNQTIRNHVMQNDFAVSVWDDITDHLGADLELHYRIFSDGNHENDFSFAPQYSIDIRKTKLALGWSLEYADFAKPTSLGYYAPRGLLSNQPTVSWKFDRAGYYGLLKVGLGRAFRLYESQWMPAFSGTGAAALGKRLTERTVAEWYLTAGRDALGMPTTWSSMNTGFKLNYSF